MVSIFNDEWCENGQIWRNPCRTRLISPLDSVARCLKWPTLRRNPRLARNKISHADAAKLILNRS